MQEPLISDAEHGESPRQVPRGLRLRGGADDSVICFAMCVIPFVVIVFFGIGICVGGLEPNRWGLLRSTLTGKLEPSIYGPDGGLFFVGALKEFIEFPAVQQSMSFIPGDGGSSLVIARTGVDEGDPNDCGQPIKLKCSFQYTIPKDKVTDIYLNFGGLSGLQQRVEIVSRNIISLTAQQFIPSSFWLRREAVCDTIRDTLKEELAQQAFVDVVHFQLMDVQFATEYENSITQVQVAEEMQAIFTNYQGVQNVTNEIALQNAENQMNITVILAEAWKTSQELVADAFASAFNLTQWQKTQSYAEIATALGFNSSQMQSYFKIKALNFQQGNPAGKVVVAVPPPRVEL